MFGCDRALLLNDSVRKQMEQSVRGPFHTSTKEKLDVFSATDCHQTHICKALMRSTLTVSV